MITTSENKLQFTNAFNALNYNEKLDIYTDISKNLFGQDVFNMISFLWQQISPSIEQNEIADQQKSILDERLKLSKDKSTKYFALNEMNSIFQ